MTRAQQERLAQVDGEHFEMPEDLFLWNPGDEDRSQYVVWRSERCIPQGETPHAMGCLWWMLTQLKQAWGCTHELRPGYMELAAFFSLDWHDLSEDDVIWGYCNWREATK